MVELNKEYWEARYDACETGWDAKGITTPIKNYFDQLTDKSAKILIPGCGNAHEAAYLYERGFVNTYICDWAEQPLRDFAERVPTFPQAQLLHSDFFELQHRDFDFIVEQTFFCALPPAMRPRYAAQMRELLRPRTGKLVGLMFDFPLDVAGLPPYGGSQTEYLSYFEPYFEHIDMKRCDTSIKPRAGRELWVELW